MITPNGGVFGRNPKFNNVTVDGNLTIPRGTTAQRPASPTAGMVRHNTDTGKLEHYNGTAWQTFQPETLEVEYLVVGGGGGGGHSGSFAGGGGGGAGGFRTNVGSNLLSLASGTTYTVTIGAGGGTGPSSGNASTFSSISAAGGGRGGSPGIGAASSGGSGGGAEGTTAALGNTPATVPSQGNNGGIRVTSGLSPDRSVASGGGGGASEVGGDPVIGTAGAKGGDGTVSDISGSPVTYAGGGGGGYGTESAVPTPCDGGAGGAGGGGKGGGTSAAVAGAANSGGGGGGKGVDGTGPTTYAQQAGGSGIVIVRYLGTPRAVGGTITEVGGYTIHTFTSSGTFSAPFTA